MSRHNKELTSGRAIDSDRYSGTSRTYKSGAIPESGGEIYHEKSRYGYSGKILVVSTPNTRRQEKMLKINSRLKKLG